MTKKRGHGEGSIDRRADDVWRLRYRVGGRRYAKTVRGSLQDARKQLRHLLKTGDDGVHVAPARHTLAAWIDEWLLLRARKVSAGTLEHYSSLLRVHVVPTLGHRVLQEIDPVEIDDLYRELGRRLSARSVRHVGVVLKACLRTAVLKRRLADNPASRADAPETKSSDAWNILDPDQLTALARGFEGRPLYGIVRVAIGTGMRRNEILALRWADVDFDKATIAVCRSVEETKLNGRTVKEPKTDRGRRVIMIDANLLAMLRAEYARHLRMKAGVPDGAEVTLTLVRLPAEALVFPSPMAPFDFTRLRNPTSVTKEFVDRAAALGFPIRLHDLRHSHASILLSKGMPIHDVAGRLGHSASVLLATYAHRMPKADQQAADIMAAITGGLT
jgi:integrase